MLQYEGFGGISGEMTKLIGATIDEHHGSYDHGGGEAHFQRERFSTIEPTKKNGDDGIDVGVRGHQRGGIVLEEPAIGGERDYGAKKD